MRSPVKPAFVRSPAGLFVILAASLFVAEVIVMLLLAALPAMPPLLADFLDATLLIVLAIPALRAFAFAPLLRQLRAREETDQQLREANRTLEQRVQERTHEMQQTNHALQREVVEHTRAEELIREQTGLANLEADVGTVLTRGGTLAEMLQLCSEAIVKRLDAAFARIWTLNEKDKVLELQASAGVYTHLNGPHSRVPVGTFKIGLIASERKPHLTNQVVGDPRVGDQEWAKR
jgi:hypothetical protein